MLTQANRASSGLARLPKSESGVVKRHTMRYPVCRDSGNTPGTKLVKYFLSFVAVSVFDPLQKSHLLLDAEGKQQFPKRSGIQPFVASFRLPNPDAPPTDSAARFD